MRLGCPEGDCEWKSDPFEGENYISGFAGVALGQYESHYVKKHLPPAIRLVGATKGS